MQMDNPKIYDGSFRVYWTVTRRPAENMFPGSLKAPKHLHSVGYKCGGGVCGNLEMTTSSPNYIRHVH